MIVLKDEHKRFADKYFETLNATQSAVYAGFSEATAKQGGYQILIREDVQEYLKQLRDELSEKTGISQQKVLNEIAKIAFADIRDYYRGDNELIPVIDLSDNAAAALSSLKILEEKLPGTDIVVGISKEIKLYDKLAGLEKLARHLGMYEKDNAQSKAETITLPVINVYQSGPTLSTTEKEIDS